MEFRANYISNIATGAKSDADAVKALRTELDRASGGLDKLDKAKGPAAPKPSALGYGSFGYGGAGARQFGSGPDLAKGLAAAAAEQKAAKEKAKASREAAKARAAELAHSGAGTIVGGAKMAAGGVLAAAGVGGAMQLAQLAMGYRGMAQLQMLTARTSLQVRRLFSGVDSSPAVRAADRFLNSLFSGTSVAGRALHGLADREINGVMRALEGGQPLATAFFQGMILGALKAENMYLRVRIALLPVTEAISGAVGPTDDLTIAAGAGAIALGAMGLAATGAAAPFIAAAAAVGLLIDQVTKLKAEWDERSLTMIKQSDAGFNGAASKSGEDRIAQQAAANYERNRNRDAREAAGAVATPAGAASGQVSGQAYADGVVKGVAGGGSAAAAAGGKLANDVDAGFRKAAEIKSPSKKAERSASYIPEGTVRGIEGGRPDVQAAADRLVPQMPSGGGATGGSSRAPVSIRIEQINHFGSGDKSSILAMIDQANAKLVRDLAQALGVSVELSAGGGAPA